MFPIYIIVLLSLPTYCSVYNELHPVRNCSNPRRSHSLSKIAQICLAQFLFSLLMLCGDIHPNPGPKVRPTVSLCHCNIRSIQNKSKLDDIRCELADKYDIITLSETWLTSLHKDNDYLIQGFQKTL